MLVAPTPVRPIPTRSTMSPFMDSATTSTDGGVVADFPFELEVRPCVTIGRSWHSSLDRDLVMLQHRCRRPVEKLGDRDTPLAGAAAGDLGLERQQHRGPIALRVRMASEPTSVPRLRTIGSEISGAAAARVG